MLRALLTSLVVVCFCGPCCGQWVVGIRADDQQSCYAQASYRARHRITGHVGRTIGSYEGVGWSSRGIAPTCVPRRRMVLTGDVTVVSRGGSFRVRSWRDLYRRRG